MLGPPQDTRSGHRRGPGGTLIEICHGVSDVKSWTSWVETFYTKQDEWAHVYNAPVGDFHREQARTIRRLGGAHIRRVLELGAGGGQTACAAADAGYEVVAVELVSRAVDHARRLSTDRHQGNLTIIQADFYQVEIDGRFDAVCYWGASFGIGTDAEQRFLLKRIADWLVPAGCALIDVLTPWYWANAAEQGMAFGDAMRRYEFDPHTCRMLDRWWLVNDPEHSVSQSLRCYSPADLRLLIEGTGLRLELVEPGGAMDYARGKYLSSVPLLKAMSYTAKLTPH